MTRTIARLLLWLDQRIRPLECPVMRHSVLRNPDGQFDVEIQDLKVWVFRRGDFWIAHGLDIDYVAAGESLDQAKMNFEAGLGGTILINLERFGHLDQVLRPAPPEVHLSWRRWMHRRNASLCKTLAPDRPHEGNLFPWPKLGGTYFEPCGV